MAHFFFARNAGNRVVVMRSDKKLFALLEPTVSALGLELWGIEHLKQGRHSLLRIYIDSDAGVGIEDCERVSRQVSGILDVEDPISGEYTLEVSSPGFERRLFTPKQFSNYVGHMVSVRLQSLKDGRRNFKGILKEVADTGPVVTQDGKDFSLLFGEIEKAHLIAADSDAP